MAFWRRIWQRDGTEGLAACTALDVGTEFAKALVFEIDDDGHGHRPRRRAASGRASRTCSRAPSRTSRRSSTTAPWRSRKPRRWPASGRARSSSASPASSSRASRRPTARSASGRTSRSREAELQKLIDGVQREALSEAERAITWETGLPHVDVRLVHAAVDRRLDRRLRADQPGRLPGPPRQDRRSSTRSRRSSTSARCRASPSQLDLELLEIVAEPYAVARVLGTEQVRQSGALFVDVGGGTTDVALVRQGGIEGTRMFALGGRAFTKSLADRLDLPFPRAEALKVDYARGLAGRAPGRRRDDHRRGRPRSGRPASSW